METSIFLTWSASTLCSIGMCLMAASALRSSEHFLVDDPFFLPLYFAGIVQWAIWGIRISDPAIIYPSIPQILILTPLIFRWYQARVI